MADIISSATGRRKTAVARVQIANGEGKFEVNRRETAAYFPSEALRTYMFQPLKIAGVEDKYDIRAFVKGGGLSGQAGAVRHAIARALCLADPTLRAPLKSAGCLTRDSRMKERKKPGQPGARARFQFSKR